MPLLGNPKPTLPTTCRPVSRRCSLGRVPCLAVTPGSSKRLSSGGVRHLGGGPLQLGADHLGKLLRPTEGIGPSEKRERSEPRWSVQ